ncbi:MAG: GtrA family protein [Muribaculaceae bacterium]|nr:GtrA family protein [Muribaculaceae bacterium]
MGTIKKVGNNLIKSDKFIYTFLRSAVSSQTASWVDLGTAFILFAFVGLTPWLSTAIGAVMGGVINCIINYKYTFHAQGCPWKAVAVKYAMVWVGSLLLNSFGTQALYYILCKWHWLESLGFRPDGYFAAARLVVSLLVSWFWNFLLQRYFVYSITRFDSIAIKLVDLLKFKHNDTEQ